MKCCPSGLRKDVRTLILVVILLQRQQMCRYTKQIKKDKKVSSVVQLKHTIGMMIHLNLVKCFSAIILLKKIYIAVKKWEKINKSEKSIVWGFFLCAPSIHRFLRKAPISEKSMPIKPVQEILSLF